MYTHEFINQVSISFGRGHHIFWWDLTLFTLELFAPLQDCLFYTIARSEADQAVTFLTGTLAGALRPRNGHFPHLMATAQKRQLAQKV